MHTRKASLAIFGVFFFESSVIGQWIPRIPDIRDSLALSDALLGLALLMMPLGTLLGFTIAGRLIELTGLRLACRLFLPLWALLFIGTALANDLQQLCLALVVAGLTIGLIEVAMNTEAARIERAAGKRLMSRCHGFWSLGTMVGALSGGAVAQAGLSVELHFLIAMPLIALCGYLAASALPRRDELVAPAAGRESGETAASEISQRKGEITTSSQVNQAPRVFRLPSRAILLLCLMPLGINMVEGAFIDWSAAFMRDVMSADALMVAVVYAAFSLSMALVRLSGDLLAERYGDFRVVRVSGLAACAGVVVFAMAPSVAWALLGAAMAGGGVAIVFPLAVTAAANRAAGSPADNVASLNMIAFSAFLLSPPLIGFLSEAMGLRVALLLLAPLTCLTFLLARQVLPPVDQTSIR